MRSPIDRLVLITASVFLIGLLALAPSASALEFARGPEADQGLLQPTPEPPAPPAEERIRLAFPGFEPGVPEVDSLFPGRVVDRDFADWPPMRYLGDSAHIAGKTFTVQEVLLVPGETYAIVYEPATRNKRAAPGGLRTNLFDFSKNTGVFIPPNTTLVMVRIEVEPEAILPPPREIGCFSPDERVYDVLFRVSYPRRGETQVILTSHVENFGRFGSPTHFCLTDGWSYFHIGDIGIDPSSLWFEIVDGEVDMAVALWTLSPLRKSRVTHTSYHQP